MWPIGRPPQWVGRGQELAILHAGIEALGHGEGTVVWVEGEPGIGKSSLVAEALAGASQPEWDFGWAAADQLTGRLPLRVMQDCLQVRSSSPDPRRVRAAGLLRDRLSGGDTVNGIEVLLTLADELCVAGPTVLVVDDLQWADEASLAVWHQLAVAISQLRLLLIGTCRPTPRRPEVQQIRAAVMRRGGQVITLGPLAETDAVALVTVLIGAPPGHEMRRLTAQAVGNPLYIRELVDALLREQKVRITPVAEVASAGERLPVSLAGVLDDRLSSVSAETAQLLRSAALLGSRFAVTDLALVLRRPVSDMVGSLQEAVTAGIVEGSGAELAFRHPLIRQALYESMPEALRTALHAEAAHELMSAGADALRVAQNQDFLVAAHALSLEQSGEAHQAMLRLAQMIPRPDNEMTLIQQWLPDLVRLALAAGDTKLARAAAQACADEAAAETRRARAAAASLRCHGLLESDTDRLVEAVAHYRSVGPAAELAVTLEDLAVALAGRGREVDARAALDEAVSRYEGMQAQWDIRRAEGRLRPHGIKRGTRGRRTPRAVSGWEALTPTEVKIAALVARGDSTPDIARGLYLSRRTVQTYISRILTKLQAKSRVDIVREAFRQGVVSPE